jgi:hypothetical protein
MWESNGSRQHSHSLLFCLLAIENNDWPAKVGHTDVVDGDAAFIATVLNVEQSWSDIHREGLRNRFVSASPPSLDRVRLRRRQRPWENSLRLCDNDKLRTNCYNIFSS